MDKKLFRKLILLITYAIVLVAFLIKLDAVTHWVTGVLGAFKPLLIGFAIAFILNRPCLFFTRLYETHLPEKGRSASRPLAILTSYVILLAAVSILISLVVPELVRSIQTFVGNLSAYAANLQVLYDTVVDTLELEALEGLNLTSLLTDSLNKLLSGALNLLTNTLPHLITVTGAVISGLVTTLLSLIFSVYMLSGAPRLVAQCRRVVTTYLPRRTSDTVLAVARLTADTFTKYISGQLVEACILGGLCFLGMCLFRFDYAPLISVIIAVSALIPVAGAYLGAGLAALLLVMIDPLQALLFLLFLVILQQLEGNLIYPRVVGSSLGLPGIWVLASVTVGSSLLGFVGLIISVPVTAILYTLLKRDMARRGRIRSAEEAEG